MNDSLTFEVYGNTRDEVRDQAQIGAENYYGKDAMLEIELSVTARNSGVFAYHATVWAKLGNPW